MSGGAFGIERISLPASDTAAPVQECDGACARGCNTCRQELRTLVLLLASEAMPVKGPA